MTAPENPPQHPEHADLFAGRPNELRALRAAAVSARAGSAAVVLVQGAPGTGKSALVHHWLGGLAGFTVLGTAATPARLPDDFDCLSRLLGTVRNPARHHCPAGRQRGTTDTGPGTPGLPTALRRLLNTSSAAPLALFVDDAQWADGPSLRALLEAARTGGRICLVLAARHFQDWDEQTLRALHRVHPLTRIGLGELSESEARTVVAAALGDRADESLTRRLILRSGRHPLYLTRLLGEHLDAPAGGGTGPGLPPAAVRRQLCGLPPSSVAALEALAVLGGSASVPTLSAVLGAPDCTLALEPPAREEFITRTVAQVPTVTFRHPVFRDGLYDALPTWRRRALHLAAVPAVDGRLRLTHKVAAAETADSRLAADLLERATDELAEGQLLAAARSLLSSAALSHAEDHRTGHLLYGAVRLLFWAGADAEIGRHADAVASRRPCPWRDEALGLVEFAAGRLTSAVRLLERARRSLAAHDPGQRAVVLAELAWAHAILGQGQAAQRYGEQALDPARAGEAAHATAASAGVTAAPDGDLTAPCGGGAEDRDGAPGVVVPPGVRQAARALAAYGAALWHGPRSGLEMLATLPEDADEIEEEGLPALTIRGVLRLADGRLRAATTDLTMVLARGRPGAARLLGTAGSVHLVMCHLLDGDWDRAALEADRALEDEQSRCFDAPVLWSLRSVLHAFRGEHDAADTALRQAVRLAQSLDFAGPHYHTAMARAMHARARGDHEGVVVALQLLADRFVHSDRVRIVATGWLPFFAESLVVCGLADLAQGVLSELREAGDDADPHLRVAQAWVAGRTAEAAGEHRTALRTYTEATGLLTPGQDIPLLRALLRAGCGRVAKATGRVHAAAEHFRVARDILTRLGARPFLAECPAQREAALADGTDGTPGHPRLTEREGEVAQLVGRGYTNREIAEALTLSAKTVEYHLRSVFVKLGVRNRRELRRRVQGEGD
ncbi:LuxR C-terminal-related transcriptional regulator [Streptomyces sp. AM6-12]|uniref:LuxR C-terminal-related transcriptional regulator n=1 Tax=Streptomyces sp. AM6-12 TaxID=3345149 RepID=UPI0037929C32